MSNPLISTTLILVSLFCVGSVGSPVSADDGGPEIKLATYNIRYANTHDGEDVWPQRASAVVAFAGELDIIGMQEVTASQFKQLREQLPKFESYGVGRDDGQDAGEHTPIFYREDRFSLLDEGTFWLSEQPEAVGQSGWDAALPRICSWVRLRDSKTDQELLVANTHFDHRGSQARAESGKLIAGRIGNMSPTLPAIVMGDLNCLPGSPPYQAVATRFRDARLVSVSEPSGPNSTWNGFQEIVPDRVIDHIFVRDCQVDHVTVSDPRTEHGRFASDHLPVVATIRTVSATAGDATRNQ